jgi:hypothetical protein
MPSRLTDASRRSVTSLQDEGIPSASVRRTGNAIFDQTDPAAHMLGLPKSHPQLGRWVMVAIVVGCAVALLMIGIFTQ